MELCIADAYNISELWIESNCIFSQVFPTGFWSMVIGIGLATGMFIGLVLITALTGSKE